MNLSTIGRFQRVMGQQAAGTDDTINSGFVDTKACGAVLFILSVGDIVVGAEASVKLQASEDTLTWEDLEGTQQTIEDNPADSDSLFLLDLLHPRHRYVRAVVTRATQNVEIDSIVAVAYNVNREPASQDHEFPADSGSFIDDVAASVRYHAPAEGTA